jgi:peptide/nickel transport system substrate-binding protein
MAVGGALQDGMVDPGGIYAGYEWNLSQLYARTLMMVSPTPTAPGQDLVPDLATEPGKPSNGGRRWTYTLRRGLKYEDRSPITAQDIKYAIIRSADASSFPSAPTYLRTLLKHPLSSAIRVRGTRQITFRLRKPFAEFDHVVQLPQTAPVPERLDGSGYASHPVSSGPYMFEGAFDPLGAGFTLVRNPWWSPSVDPHRRALPDRFVVDMTANRKEVRNAVVDGTVDLGLDEGGASATSIERVRAAGGAVDVSTTELRYATINQAVAPLNDQNCRRAIALAINHESLTAAYRSHNLGGELATNLLPPGIPGREPVDPFRTTSHPTGDVPEAKQAMAACSRPDGFSFDIAYLEHEDADKAAAEAIRVALARIKIDATPLEVEADSGDRLERGKCSSPSWLEDNSVGMCLYSWSPDWQDGYGFLDPLVDSRARLADGTSYNFSVRDDEIDGLIDQALASEDPSVRDGLWSQIDRRVVEQARFIPAVYVDRLLVQPPRLTNLWVNPTYGAYDYAAVGVVDGGRSQP